MQVTVLEEGKVVQWEADLEEFLQQHRISQEEIEQACADIQEMGSICYTFEGKGIELASQDEMQDRYDAHQMGRR